MKNTMAVLAAALVAAAPALVAAAPATADTAGSGWNVVADWELDDPAGSTTAVDSGPNGINATAGSDISKGLSDSTGSFYRWLYTAPNKPPAKPQRLITADSPLLNPMSDDFRITMTFRTTRNFGNIIQKGQHGAPGGYFKIENPKGHLTCLFRGVLPDGSLKGVLVNSAGTVNDGQWHTMTCERTADAVTMTIDGTKTTRTKGQTGSISNKVPVTIGGKMNCDQVAVTCDYFTGDLGRVEIASASTAAPSSGFVASTGAASSSKTAKVVVPASIKAGQLLLLQSSYVNTAATASAPSGWSQLGSADANGLGSSVWWKIATASDAGSKVPVTLTKATKSTVQLLAYSGVNQALPFSAVASGTDTKSSATHVTPTVKAKANDYLVSLWSDKSAATSSWAAPNGVTTRDAKYGTGSGYVSSLAADSGSVRAGTQGGLLATTNAAGARGTMWTIALSMLNS